MQISLRHKRKAFFRLTAIVATVSLFSYAYPNRFSVFAASRREVIVAVIDTGVNTEHEHLKGSIWVNNKEIPGNGIDDDDNGYADDLYGWDFYNNDASVFHDIPYSGSVSGNEYEDDHGTHVAGLIISAFSEGRKLLRGTDLPDVKLMILKINGGPEAEGSTRDAVKAIEYAEKNGASICNLSWGGYENDSALMRAVEKSKMLFVCCAGNDGTDNDIAPVYPASYVYDNVLSVTGAEIGEDVRITGNYGRLSVDLCADSLERMSSVSHGWGFKSGASMATAEVCGQAALLMSVSALSSKKIAEIMIDSADETDKTYDAAIRGGLCNIEKALERVLPNKGDITKRNAEAVLLSHNEVTVEKGLGFTLNCLVLPAACDETVMYWSSDENVARVSYNGLIICEEAGDAVVTVKLDERTVGSCKVHVR